MNTELEKKLLELINKIDSNLPDWANTIVEYNIGTNKAGLCISLLLLILSLIGIYICSLQKDCYNIVKDGAWIVGMFIGLFSFITALASVVYAVDLYKWIYYTKAMLIQELL